MCCIQFITSQEHTCTCTQSPPQITLKIHLVWPTQILQMRDNSLTKLQEYTTIHVCIKSCHVTNRQGKLNTWYNFDDFF